MIASLVLSAALIGTPNINVHNWETSNAWPSSNVTSMQSSVLVNPEPSAQASFGWIGVFADNILFQVGWQQLGGGEVQPFEAVINTNGTIYSWNAFPQTLHVGDYLGVRISYSAATNNWSVWFKPNNTWIFAGKSPMPFKPGSEEFQVSTEVWGGAPIPLVSLNTSTPVPAPVLVYVQ